MGPSIIVAVVVVVVAIIVLAKNSSTMALIGGCGAPSVAFFLLPPGEDGAQRRMRVRSRAPVRHLASKALSKLRTLTRPFGAPFPGGRGIQ